jgi:hypothetical protein
MVRDTGFECVSVGFEFCALFAFQP